MKKISMVTLAFLAMATTVHASQDNSLRKLVDGSVRNCTSAADVNREVNVQMALKGSTLSINLVRCESDGKGAGRYVLESSVKERSFKAINGERVDESYSQFELVLVDKNSQVLEVHSLNNLAQTSQETLNIEKLEAGTELFVRAVRSYKSESGISDKNILAWGSYRF